MRSGSEDEVQPSRSRRFIHYRTRQVGNPCFPHTGWLYGHKGKDLALTVDCCMHYIPNLVVEEIQAVRFHLASLINTFQYHGQGTAFRLSCQPVLLQRLLEDLDHWREDQDNPVDHLLVAELRSDRDESLIANKEQWGWGMWDAERLSKRGLKPGTPYLFARLLSDKKFRECEDTQFTYIDRWVAEKYMDDVRPVEEEKRQQEEKAKQEEEKAQEKHYLRFPKIRKNAPKDLQGSKKAQRKAIAKVLIQNFGKDNGREGS